MLARTATTRHGEMNVNEVPRNTHANTHAVARQRTLVAAALLSVTLITGRGIAQRPEPVALHVERDTLAGEVVLVYGPVDLPAGGMPDTPVRVGTLEFDGWLRGYRVDLVDSAGRPVPQRLLHHVNVIAPDKRELFSNIMLRIAAAGGETAPVALPWVFGYRIRPGDSVIVSAMLHNPTDTAYHAVRMLVHLPYRPADRWVPSADVYPFYLDVMPPAGSHSFDLPVGRSVHSWEGKPAIPGRILAVGGHMHRYGVSLRLEDVTDRKLLWEGKPMVDSTGEVVGFPVRRFFTRLGLSVDTSHVYRLSAVYDNTSGRVIVDGGMGALGGVFLPASSASWPRVDPRSAEYQLDRQLTMRLTPGVHATDMH